MTLMRSMCIAFSRRSLGIPSSEAAVAGCPRSYRSRPEINENLGLPILGNVGMRLLCVKPKEGHPMSSSMLFRNFEHSGYPEDPDMKGFPRLGNSSARTRYPNVPEMEGAVRNGNFKNSVYPKSAETEGPLRPMDYVRGLMEDEGKPRVNGPRFSRHGAQFSRYNTEQNADTVHIKILKNNTFVTLTDSKGNKKAGSGVSISAGALPDKMAGKNSGLGAEASAEHVGRKARDIGVKSVVVKVNGYTMFKKKRGAIMSFREGYNRSRGNQNPVVYIEDTTRRPHNGCRRRKQRRI